MQIPNSAKQAALELVQRLSDDVTFEDIMYELLVLQKIERGLRDVEEERIHSHEEVRRDLEKWLK